MTDFYFSIAGPSEGLFKDRGSRFIGYAFPVTTEAEIKGHLNELKKQHHAARHWCYAYRLGADKKTVRANDDGEPSGTAGKPILNQILAADLSNVLLVVVRYFGGTLLGTGGLIQAYKTAAAEALKQALVTTCYLTVEGSVLFDTTETNIVMRTIKEYGAEIKAHQFTEQNEIIFSIRLSLVEKLRTSLSENQIRINIRDHA